MELAAALMARPTWSQGVESPGRTELTWSPSCDFSAGFRCWFFPENPEIFPKMGNRMKKKMGLWFVGFGHLPNSNKFDGLSLLFHVYIDVPTLFSDTSSWYFDTSSFFFFFFFFFGGRGALKQGDRESWDQKGQEDPAGCEKFRLVLDYRAKDLSVVWRQRKM